MSIALLVICVIAICAVVVIIVKGIQNPANNINIPQIHKCESIRDMVMSINHGRIYPYFTGMNLERVKNIVRQNYQDTTYFDNYTQIGELMGYMPIVDLPQCENYFIERITLGFNKQMIVSSITIKIKNYDYHRMDIIEEMVLKFGKPFSSDLEFVIWRDGWMVINLDRHDKSISIIDERLFAL